MDIINIITKYKLDTTKKEPIYLQLAGILLQAIDYYGIPRDTRLPPERALASLFSVSRTSTIAAYQYLEQQGVVYTKKGSGTYVGEPPRETIASNGFNWSRVIAPYQKDSTTNILRDIVSGMNAPGTISFAPGVPHPEYYPISSFTSWNEIAPEDLGHIPTEGYLPLRHQMLQQLRQREIHAGLEEILITSGSQQSLYLLSRILIIPGDYVVMESPGYIGALQVFQNAGARILTLDPENPSLSTLENFFSRYRPKCLYLNPTFQNPTGSVLHKETREKILGLCKKFHVLLIEDDCYSPLHYDREPPAPVKTLPESDAVVFLGTFSKTLFPGIRLGYVVGEAPLINRMITEKQLLDLHTNNLSQIMLERYLSSDQLEKHLQHVRLAYKERRNLMLKALKEHCGKHLTYNIPQGGVYFWCRLHKPIPTKILMQEAAAQGVFFLPGEVFTPQQENTGTFRLCFSSPTKDDIAEGIRRLGIVLEKTKEATTGAASFYSHTPII